MDTCQYYEKNKKNMKRLQLFFGLYHIFSKRKDVIFLLFNKDKCMYF
jgi:hypothetical protein